MFMRGITLSLATLLACSMMAESAQADHRKRQRRMVVEEEYYPGPAFIREVPGLRIFFGDYALSEEEFDQLYGTGRRVYRDEPPPRKRYPGEQRDQPQPKKKTAAKTKQKS